MAKLKDPREGAGSTWPQADVIRVIREQNEIKQKQTSTKWTDVHITGSSEAEKGGELM